MTRILILDDNKELRELLKEELLDDFPEAQIDTTGNLADAIRLSRGVALTGDHYDVALLDAKVLRDPQDRTAPDLHPDARRELLAVFTYLTVVINYSIW